MENCVDGRICLESLFPAVHAFENHVWLSKDRLLCRDVFHGKKIQIGNDLNAFTKRNSQSTVIGLVGSDA